jgi:LysR family transcriptional regulator, hydrogen peroxide-inducible genes activator
MRLSSHPVTLRQLQYLVAVADARSFRRAADGCHVSQPSLSAQIAQAEDALGVQVFERDRRRVVLTRAGAVVIERARALLLSADDLVDICRQLAEPMSGSLRLGIIPTIGPYLLPEVSPLLRARFPRLGFVWIEDKTATLTRQLAAGDLDGAIVATEAELGELASVRLGSDEFVFACGRDHTLGRSKKPIAAGDLDGESVLLLDDGHCFRDQALAFCARAGADELGFRATSLPTLAHMVASGAGVTLLPMLAVATENRRQTLHIRRFVPRAPARTVALVWRKGSPLETTLRPVGEAMREAYAALAR